MPFLARASSFILALCAAGETGYCAMTCFSSLTACALCPSSWCAYASFNSASGILLFLGKSAETFLNSATAVCRSPFLN